MKGIRNITPQDSDNFYRASIYQTPGCTLQAYGKHFDPRAFLERTDIPEDRILLKGSLGLPAGARMTIESGKLPYDNAFDIFDTPWLILSVSTAADLRRQTDDAILFLRQYAESLEKLKSHPVENTLMQFLTDGGEKVRSVEFPEEFNQLYQTIGIQNLLTGSMHSSN